jgi:hypothetical protein
MGAQILPLQKSFAEQEQKQAELGKTKAEAVLKQTELYRNQLSSVQTPAQGAAWVQSQYADPILGPVVRQVPMEQAIAGIPTDPKKFEDWKNQNGIGMTEWAKRNMMTAFEKGHLGTLQTTAKAAADREARMAAGGDLKPVPVHAQKAITGATSTIAQLDKAIAQLKANPDAVGLKGLTPDIALNRMDPEGTDARAGVADIGSLKIHDRSGAAVTASETPRLKPFIPSITDDYDTAIKKLERMRDIQLAEQEVLTGTYNKEQGFRDFSSPQPTGTTPAPATPAKPSAPAATSNVVTLPNGSSMTFPNAKAAAEFKKKAGL